MGLFDDISIYMACPYCSKYGDLGAQTKDLTCEMYCYHPLDDDWEAAENLLGKSFREGLPVFLKFPYDKEHTVWKDQAERTEAQAMIPAEFVGKLNFVNVVARCESCGKHFKGKVRVAGDKLIGEIYDITERV